MRRRRSHFKPKPKPPNLAEMMLADFSKRYRKGSVTMPFGPTRDEVERWLSGPTPGPDPGACPNCGQWIAAGMTHSCDDEYVPGPAERVHPDDPLINGPRWREERDRFEEALMRIAVCARNGSRPENKIAFILRVADKALSGP